MDHSMMRGLPNDGHIHNPIHTVDEEVKLVDDGVILISSDANYTDFREFVEKLPTRHLTSIITQVTPLQKILSIFRQILGRSNNMGHIVSPCREFHVIELAIVYDASFCNLFDNVEKAESRIRDLIAATSTLYQNTVLCVKIDISDLQGSCNATEDLYRNITLDQNPIGRLNKFGDYWKMNRNDTDRTIAHLYTGKPLDGEESGIAYISTICKPMRAGYGTLSFDENCDFTMIRNLIAHEIGHSMGVRDPIEDPGMIMSDPVCPYCTDFGSEALEIMSETLSCLSTETNDLFVRTIDREVFEGGRNFDLVSTFAIYIAGFCILIYAIAFLTVSLRRRQNT